jgi:hypothetical protein
VTTFFAQVTRTFLDAFLRYPSLWSTVEFRIDTIKVQFSEMIPDILKTGYADDCVSGNMLCTRVGASSAREGGLGSFLNDGGSSSIMHPTSKLKRSCYSDSFLSHTLVAFATIEVLPSNSS